MGLINPIKNSSKPLFAQILELVPSHIIVSPVSEHRSGHYTKSYPVGTQLIAMLSGLLDHCGTAGDIVAGFSFLRDLSLENSPERSTMGMGIQTEIGVFMGQSSIKRLPTISGCFLG